MSPAEIRARREQEEVRKRDPDATRAAILDAAEGLFLKLGPDATPVSQVARQAGVTKSLIHHHFGSKEGLWSELKRRHFEQYYEAQKGMLTSAQGAAELLHDSIIAYFRFLQSDPRSVRFMSWRFVEVDDTCFADEDELFELGIEKIQEAQVEGTLRPDIEPLFMIKAFLSMTLQWFQTKPMLRQMLEDPAEIDEMEEKYLQDIVKLFLEGVLPRS